MFFTIYMRRKASDSSYANNIFTYSTEDEAYHQFYATMSTYGMDPIYDYVRCLVIDENGAVLKNDCSDHRTQPQETE